MKLNAIGILCADIPASLDFYRRLGVPFPEYDPATGHYEAALGGGVRLMLDSHDIANAVAEDFTAPAGNDVITLAIECADPSAVDATFELITGAGAPPIRPPFDAFWGQRYATVGDPDGNPVDLYAAFT